MGLTIKRLTVHDVLRVSVVDIAPDGNVVTLGGKNGAGKSSVLNAIEMAFAGKRAAPLKPIREGASSGRVVADLGDFVVERTFTPSGGDLVVRSKDGARYPKPQAMLDALFASVAFDPIAFARSGTREQADTLRRLLGVDFADLDAEQGRVYEQRTEVGRELRHVEARVAAVPEDRTAPDGEVDVAALSAELEAGLKVAQENAAARRELERHRSQLTAADGRRIELLRLLAESEMAVEGHSRALAAAETDVSRRSDPDLAPLRALIAAAGEVNVRVRAQRERRALVEDATRRRAESEALTARLAEIDTEKRARIGAAPFPVDDLGFDDDGVTLRGLPFAQAGTAEKLRVSVAIGVASNPKLQVFFIRDGSLLDADSLALVAGMARANDCQFWIEDARTTDPAAIMIADGTVRPE